MYEMLIALISGRNPPGPISTQPVLRCNTGWTLSGNTAKLKIN